MPHCFCPNFRTTNFKVWTVLSTEENVLLSLPLPGMFSFVPSAITQPFFELQTPDFAWKFICAVQPNEKVQKYKSTKVQKYKKIKKM